MISAPEPQLSPSEWRAVATALRDANEAPSPGAIRPTAVAQLCAWFLHVNPAVQPGQDDGARAIRMFVEDVREKHRVSPSLAEMLQTRGFNQRQISALAILAD